MRNREKMAKICRILSTALVIWFFIAVLIGYIMYSNVLNSAPFRVWILMDGLYYLVPAMLIRIIGMILYRKK